MSFGADLLIPEIYQLLVILALFIQTLRESNEGPPAVWPFWVAGAGVLVAFFALGSNGLLFWGSYRIDGLSQFFKLAVALGFFITMFNARNQPSLQETKRADYNLFFALSVWGLMLLSSAVELMTVYIALEISSYSLYALIPLRANSKEAAEAGIKYILFGAVVTAVAMYGFSYVLATQGTTYIAELAGKPWSFQAAPLAVIGLTLFLGGLFYKLALFPFHFWCPDVYEGASNETAAYAATLPKLGAVVVLVRLAGLLKPGLEITTILAVLGAVSMTFGNISALVQKDVKRILGYSSVAHAGYVMLGLVAGTAAGLAAASFYSLVYLLMNLTCFWVLCRLSDDGRNINVEDLNGLYRRSPALAFVLAVSAFALVGLPPTAGFMGKLFLLSAAWERGYNWLVIIAVLNTAISIYYYLNLVRHAYTCDSEAEEVRYVSRGNLLFGGILASAVLLLGTVPGPVFQYALKAGRQLLPAPMITSEKKEISVNTTCSTEKEDREVGPKGSF